MIDAAWQIELDESGKFLRRANRRLPSMVMEGSTRQQQNRIYSANQFCLTPSSRLAKILSTQFLLVVHVRLA